MKKMQKKGVCILLIALLLLPMFQNIALAYQIGQSALIKYDKDCELSLQFWNKNVGRWSYVTCSFVYYEQDGKQYPAYCLDKRLTWCAETPAMAQD